MKILPITIIFVLLWKIRSVMYLGVRNRLPGCQIVGFDLFKKLFLELFAIISNIALASALFKIQYLYFHGPFKYIRLVASVFYYFS